MKGDNMFYTILEKFFVERVDCSVWDYLGIDQSVWCRYKKSSLPLKHYKKICSELEIPINDNQKELSNILVEKYYESR